MFERVRPFIGAWRAAYKNPHLFSNLERHVQRLEAWREHRAPGTTENMRQMMARMRQAATVKKRGKK